MTDQEAKLMRDLEKAAIGFVGDPHRYRTIASGHREMDAVKVALDALTAYRATLANGEKDDDRL